MNNLPPKEESYSKGYSKAEDFFKECGIDFPFIPIKERKHLLQLQPDLFGTRDPATSIYDFNRFFFEVLQEKVANYVLLGMGGHGFNSNAIHYYAVNEHLAIFFQLNYLNIFRDEKTEKERISGIFSCAELFFNAIEEADVAGLIPNGRRLLIVESDFYGRGWSWIEEGQEAINLDAWHADEPLIAPLQSIPTLSTNVA